MVFRSLTAFTNEGEEWVHSYSFEEHKRSLAIAEESIRRNQLW